VASPGAASGGGSGSDSDGGGAGSSHGGSPTASSGGDSSATSASTTQQTARLLAEWADIKRRALGIMEDYQWRVNGSYVKEYDSLVAWDFRLADAEWAAPQAQFLAGDLEAFASSAVKVTVRKTRVELSLRATNKGRLAASLLARSAHAQQQQAPSGGGDAGPPFDFILVAGDDTTDEPMYEAAKEWAARHACPAPFTVSIGHSGKRTCADALLPDVDAMQRLVVDLAAV
jgi:trehalose-phosphatase